MKGYIEERAVKLANYIIENNATVRQAAKQFGISKSTVHTDVHKPNDLKQSSRLAKVPQIGRNTKIPPDFEIEKIKLCFRFGWDFLYEVYRMTVIRNSIGCY